VPLLLPEGIVLKEVLGSGAGWNWVVRAGPVEDAELAALKLPLRRLYEVSSYDGSVLRELHLESDDLRAVTCAAQTKLTVIRREPAADAAKSTDATQVETWTQKIASR
jgi:hypothetical protein